MQNTPCDCFLFPAGVKKMQDVEEEESQNWP